MAPTVSPAPGDAALADVADEPADLELQPSPEPVVVVADAADAIPTAEVPMAVADAADAIPTAEVPMAVVVDVVDGAADAAAAPVDEVPPAPTPEGGECAICLAELDSGGEARTPTGVNGGEAAGGGGRRLGVADALPLRRVADGLR